MIALGIVFAIITAAAFAAFCYFTLNMKRLGIDAMWYAAGSATLYCFGFIATAGAFFGGP